MSKTRYIITRGFGDALVAASLTRGATWTDGASRHAMTFESRSKAEQFIKFYAIADASVAVAI